MGGAVLVDPVPVEGHVLPVLDTVDDVDFEDVALIGENSWGWEFTVDCEDVGGLNAVRSSVYVGDVKVVADYGWGWG